MILKGLFYNCNLLDLDDDNQINIYDLCEIMDRLTWNKEENKILTTEEKQAIAKTVRILIFFQNQICLCIVDNFFQLLREIDLQHSDNLGPAEFSHLISKMPEFKNSFYLKV